jgi:2-polyprenyl-6-methoxyphenol hydroxylase-like FAD-dependent oxidoreductase
LTVAEEPDVVIVGAGIAGGALATVLARAGLRVLTLERTLQHEDRVRGEFMAPWGVAEATRLDLLDALAAADANVIRRIIPYSDIATPEEAEAKAVELGALLPGVDGAMGVGHPALCDAFDAAAVAAGATLVRGVASVQVSAGERPEVAYELDGVAHVVRPRLVVAADGRESRVRKALDFELHETTPVVMGAGLLVTDVEGWPAEDSVIGAAGEWNYLALPQGPSTARLYLMYDMAHRHKLTGADKARTFLDAFRCDAFPRGDVFADATPAGPCAAFPMNDTWVDQPVADGVVLIGDAAGWSDPLIGQGLSVAMRDVRLVRDALVGSDDWSRDAFKGYVEERAERMRRLRYAARVVTHLNCDSAPGALERRRVIAQRLETEPKFALARAISALGPEMGPAESFTEDTMEQLLTVE